MSLYAQSAVSNTVNSFEAGEQIAREVLEGLGGRRPLACVVYATVVHDQRAVLGYECAARVGPFLGREGTLRENLALQAAVAPDAAWLGMFAWGEVCPVGDGQTFHNYSYPVVVLADPR